MSSKPIIDDHILEECYLNDEELIADVVQVFMEQKDVQVADVESAVKARDAMAVGRAAHKIKGGLLTIGAAAAGDAALKLEKMGKTGDLGDVDAALVDLHREVGRLVTALRGRKYV